MIFLEFIFQGVLTLLYLNVIYLFVFAVAGLFDTKLKSTPISKGESSYLLMVPGFKEDDVIVSVAKNLSQIDYPKDKFEVLIIADSFQEETLESLKKEDVSVLEVSFEKSTKVKALNKAFSSLTKRFDYAIIMDADNVVNKEFLYQIDSVTCRDSIKALQCHRVAKNKNTSVAILDAVSEEINNHIFRRGHVNVGLSSGLIGSGMVFDYDLIASFLKNSKAIGGFDKELELLLLKQRVKIQYLNDCFVYDEKVQKMDQLNAQRRRWLSAQVYYLSVSFRDALKDFFVRGNIDYLDKSTQMALVPRILLLGLIPVMLGLSFLFGPDSQYLSMTLFAVMVFTMMISIPFHLYNGKLLKALLSLPKGVFGMLLTIFKLKGANKTFIHTPHSTNVKS